jgi:hypothetical protein
MKLPYSIRTHVVANLTEYFVETDEIPRELHLNAFVSYSHFFAFRKTFCYFPAEEIREIRQEKPQNIFIKRIKKETQMERERQRWKRKGNFSQVF